MSKSLHEAIQQVAELRMPAKNEHGEVTDPKIRRAVKAGFERAKAKYAKMTDIMAKQGGSGTSAQHDERDRAASRARKRDRSLHNKGARYAAAKAAADAKAERKSEKAQRKVGAGDRPRGSALTRFVGKVKSLVSHTEYDYEELVYEYLSSYFGTDLNESIDQLNESDFEDAIIAVNTLRNAVNEYFGLNEQKYDIPEGHKKLDSGGGVPNWATKKTLKTQHGTEIYYHGPADKVDAHHRSVATSIEKGGYKASGGG